MTKLITIYEPVNAVDPPTISLAERPDDLAGLRVGILDNGKPNSDRFLPILGAHLETATGVRIGEVHRKPSIGRLAPPELIDAIANESDLVLTGVGDCAGCCSCTIGDAIALERRGVPVAAICTDEFATAAALAAAALGAPGYRIGILPHPFGSRSLNDLSVQAELATAQVAELLAVQRAKVALSQ